MISGSFFLMLITPLVDGLDFSHIESFESFPSEEGVHTIDASSEQWEPTQLGNGKWVCNHKCKDKAV